MNRTSKWSIVLVASIVLAMAYYTRAFAQFAHHSAITKVDVNSYPADVQTGYKLFSAKCAECHGTSASLTESRPEGYWNEVVQRMAAMASSHINNHEADLITKFLVYDQAHRKDAADSATSAKSAATLIGFKAFDTAGCSSCHSVSGQGNTAFPLDDIGSNLTPSEIRMKITNPGAKSDMPPLASNTSAEQLNALVNFLSGLKGR